MNDKILIDRAVVKQAIEALESYRGQVNIYGESPAADMCTTLRAALKQPEQCADEDDCTSMPWCRILNQCQKVAVKNADAIDTTEKRVEKTVENEHDPKDVGDAPSNSLPTWYECELIIKNDEFCKRTKAGLESQVLDTPRTTPIPTALHRFIYEYDDADSYRSEWFMHRLEQVLKEAAAQLPAAPEQEPLSQDDINWLKARPHIEQFIKEQDHDVTITDRSVTFKSREKVDVHQSKQEPVAWIPSQHLEEARRAPFVCRVSLARQRHRTDFVALYTHPPRREWVGLTNQDIRSTWEWALAAAEYKATKPQYEFAQAIEAKLKEKNV
jgi:hypothetical protein